MALMPTGNDDVWMIRVRDRGEVYKIDLLELLKIAGIKNDAFGRKLPENRGEQVKKRLAEAKAKKTKKVEKKEDETKSN